MTLEYPLDRRSSLSFGRFGEYSQLPNLGNRQSAFHLTSSTTLTKSAGAPVICSITGQRYALLLRNKIIPDLQARQCLSRIIFMQDGAPPHITRYVTDVLRHHFIEECVISRQFRHLWPPRSPDINPCDFLALGPFKTAGKL
ncbi:uncharacterized protein TNCV_3212821 [Trichonephila clavipes]|nr:uncharacterized protein TNCV_3212821 [Trichonephila clavipes]